MTSIFLSYARDDDEAFARRLHADLTKAGFDVWFDRVSMPSRQLTFHQEIRDAIAARDRLLLVVGPGVLASDYVAQEWRFAYFEAGKCVNPIVRLDGRRPDDSIVDAYELIPEDLRLLHAEDFRDDTVYEQHLQNLIRQLSEAIPPVGKLVAVPELPASFLAQPDRIKALRDLLLVDLQKPVVVSGAAARVGLQGMGGIGKSVLASALAHRPEVRRAFPDGVFWITLGQKPQMAELQRWVARELGDEALFADERSGKECLRKLLAGRKALLVLDDVWQREHAEAFNVIGAMGRILLTTRDAGLVTALASKETHYRVELPSEAEAEAIFAGAAYLELGDLPSATKEIVAQCGRLPLALALCGGMVQGGVSPNDVLEALREHDLEFLSSDHPAEEQHRNAWKAMDVSLRVLPPEQQDRFAELAVFALDRGAPEVAVVTLWEHTGGLSPRHARKLLADFAARSLVQLSPAVDGDKQASARMTLHDLLHNFAMGMAAKRFGSLAALNGRLLDAYRKICPEGWPSGPNDSYFLQNLVGHLLAAGDLGDAVALLTDLPWIEAKCKAGLTFGLQEDYRQTIEMLPEAQDELKEEAQRQSETSRWTKEIVDYARQWSARRDRLAHAETVEEREPELPKPVLSVEPWSEERIDQEAERIRVNPTPLDRLRALQGFVQQDTYPLQEFGTRAGFVVQHAFNHAPAGPVHDAAPQPLPSVEAPLLLRRWFSRDQYNPKLALLRTLEGHSGWVTSVSVMPDGRRAVSGSDDKALRVWDLESGECLRTLEGHRDEVSSVSATPDGRRAVSGSNDKTLRVWDLESGQCLRTLEGHSNWVTSVSVTPDGRRAVSGSYDETLRVWDLESGECLRTLEENSGGVTSVSVTADGRRAVSGSDDRTLRVWDLESGECLRTLVVHGDGVESVIVTADGRRAVSGTWDALRVWDLESGECLRTLGGHSGGVTSVSVTPDGRRAVSGSDDKTLRVWDLESGQCLRTLEGHSNSVSSVSVTPDGRRAVSGSDDKTLRVWDLESGQCLHTLEGNIHGVRSVSMTPDGRRAVSGSDYKTLPVWDLGSGECLRTLEGHSDWVTSVSMTPDGRRAVSGSDDETLRVWDLESGECLRTLEEDSGGVTSVSVMPDGRRAVSGSGDKTLRVWDLESGECLRTLGGHSGGVTSVSVTADGRRAVSGSNDKTLRVWDLESGECLRTLEGHSKWVTSVSATADGRRAVSGSWDNTLRAWDLATGESLRRLEGHSDGVTSVSVTADGRRAVSGSEDRTLRVWDLESGECLAVGRLPMPIRTVALSSALDRMIVGTSTGEVIFFDSHGMIWNRTETAEPIPQNPEDQLRLETAACIRVWGPSHPNTLLGKLGLATVLEQTRKQSEAIDIRRDVAKTCLSLDNKTLTTLQAEIDRLIPHLENTEDGELLLKLTSKLGVLKQERENAQDPSTQWQDSANLNLSGDYSGAEELLRAQLQGEFEVSRRHCNLTRVLLMTDRFEEAREGINQAWAAREEAPAYVVPRILFFQCVFTMLDAADISTIVGQIKSALHEPDAHAEWTIQPVLDHLRSKLGETNYRFLEALAAALSDANAMPHLDEFPQWRDATAPKSD
jgi:WD40 repeat protein